jgi:hypothetical protein
MGHRLQSKLQICWRDESQGNFHAGRPSNVGSLLIPPFGCRSQRQIVPVTTKEREKGKRKIARKVLSPFRLVVQEYSEEKTKEEAAKDEKQREKDCAHQVLAEAAVDQSGEQLFMVGKPDELEHRICRERLGRILSPVGEGGVHRAADEIIDKDCDEKKRG